MKHSQFSDSLTPTPNDEAYLDEALGPINNFLALFSRLRTIWFKETSHGWGTWKKSMALLLTGLNRDGLDFSWGNQWYHILKQRLKYEVIHSVSEGAK